MSGNWTKTFVQIEKYFLSFKIFITGFFKTGLAKKSTHFTTWQF